MTFLPIVDRELRVAARRHSTYWVRLLLALAAIVISFFLYVGNTRTPRPRVGEEIFGGLSFLALVYGLASGRRFTADCLSEEKREGTLGLLFLTDLRGYDVVLGKLAATSVSAFFGLLAIFPVIALPILLGGVTQGEFWRTLLVLVDTFLLSLAIGVFVSVWCWDARQAAGANLLLLLAIMALPPACAGAIAYFSPGNIVVHELCFSCPVYAFFYGFEINYRAGPAHFWWSVGIIHFLTWVLVALASFRAPYSWQDRAAGAGKIRWRERWQQWVYGRPDQRQALRRRLLQVNAFCWLASRARWKPALVWSFLGFVGCWWLYLRLKMEMNWWDESLGLTTAVMLNCVFKLWIAIEAGQRLAEEQKMGTLELLLSTPLSEREVVRGQLVALRRQFLKPMLVCLIVEVLFIFAIFRFSVQNDSRVLSFGFAGLILLLADSTALIWVSLSSALTSKSPNHASISTISRVMILPWIVYGAVAALVNLSTVGGPIPGWEFYLSLWFWLGIGTDLVFGVSAWRRVRTRFRELALQHVSRATREKQNLSR
jgi:ABC-type transport system involved in multi-copper enzyme maturation permease subunit